MGILRTDKISGLETPTAVTGSVNFDGNDHLEIGAAGDFNFLHNGATDWTVEFWAKTGATTRQFVWGTGASSAQIGFSLTIMSSADNQSDATGVFAMVGRGAAGSYIGWGADNCLKLNTWHHIAAVFKSSDKTLAIYVDGQEVDNDAGTVSGTFAAGNYSSSNSSYAFTVGKNLHGGGNYMNGEISNLRVVAGRRLYTSDFTPPVHALEPINGTRILCCNNPDSVTAVSNTDIGNGYTATASGDPTVATDNPSLTRDFTGGTEFRGVTTFDTQGYFVPPSGTTEQRGRGRAVFGGGDSTGQPFNTSIEYFQLQTSGMSFEFGDLTLARNQVRAVSSSTRGVFGGGRIAPASAVTDTMDFVTIASTGNATDFGDLTEARGAVAPASNSTRGVFMAGYDPANTNHIDYITIASLGNAVNFGDTLTSTHAAAGCASPTRGVMGGGFPGINTIEYITIASTGNSVDFGDRVQDQHSVAGCSSQTRGIFGSGTTPGTGNIIDFITISTLGNAQDFGDLVTSSTGTKSATSNQINGCFFGGWTGSAYVTDVQKVIIASTGNAVNFGSLMLGRHQTGATSDSHGGIS